MAQVRMIVFTFLFCSFGCLLGALSVCLSVCLLVSPSRYIFVGLSFFQYIFLACLLVYLNFFLYGFYNPTKGPVTLYPLEGGGRVVVSR